jgi:uroporphyrinogen-III synthase
VASRRFDAAIFSSPSTLLRLLEALPSSREGVETALHGMACVAIGEITAAAFRDAGLPTPAVAATPSDEGILDALRSLLAD